MIFAAGLVIGTVGWIATGIGGGTLIPPTGLGWFEIAGFVLAIPSAVYLKVSRARP